ncbi:hypothetical protein UlMin_008948 [Ulmus minor]
MGAQTLQLLPLPCFSSSSSFQSAQLFFRHYKLEHHSNGGRSSFRSLGLLQLRATTKKRDAVVLAGREDTELQVSTSDSPQENQQSLDDTDSQDLEYVGQIKRVLELLRKNRDMLFSEVKLTVMIEDPRDVERRRLLGIEELDGPTRDDLATALEEVNEGKIPENRLALRMLAEEMMQWPNLEAEPIKKKPSKSLYARATDTGIDPKVAAKRLNMDWDTAAEIEDPDTKDESEVPSALGYGALYLVTAFPVIIGVSVVLILFYNSLQ